VENETAWKALENALAADLFVAVHLTATPQIAAPGLMERLAQMGVKSLSLSAAGAEDYGLLAEIRDRAALFDLSLVWNLPVPYSDQNPVALETEGVERAEGTGRAWLYVEPDGDILPAQGVNQVLGNLLRDPWDRIWKR
jgi:hypothetical protein